VKQKNCSLKVKQIKEHEFPKILNRLKELLRLNVVKGNVFDIQRFSVHDGPGIRTIVFLKGCPLRCVWCCNPESQAAYIQIGWFAKNCIFCEKCVAACPYQAITTKISNEGKVRVFDLDKCRQCEIKECVKVCPSKAIVKFGNEKTVDEVMKTVKKDGLFYKNSKGGITVSGGEPLVQADFVRDLLAESKKMGYNTAIETSSYSSWNNFEKILEFTDLFLCDLKHMDDELHSSMTGASNAVILKNLERLSKTAKEVKIRVPVIPGFNGNVASIRDICIFSKEIGVDELHLLPYHRLGRAKYDKLFLKYDIEDIMPPSKELMADLESVAINCGLRVKIGG